MYEMVIAIGITVVLVVAAIGGLASRVMIGSEAVMGSPSASPVIAQEVRMVMPEAVVRGRDGYFRVFYEKLGLQFQSYEHWLASGARIPVHMTPLH